jgi:acetate kinase
MKAASARILTTNGGSSSIKFALFEAGDSLRRILEGGIEMTGHQIAATVREYFHKQSPAIGWKSNYQHSVAAKFCG